MLKHDGAKAPIDKTRPSDVIVMVCDDLHSFFSRGDASPSSERIRTVVGAIGRYVLETEAMARAADQSFHSSLTWIFCLLRFLYGDGPFPGFDNLSLSTGRLEQVVDESSRTTLSSCQPDSLLVSTDQPRLAPVPTPPLRMLFSPKTKNPRIERSSSSSHSLAAMKPSLGNLHRSVDPRLVTVSRKEERLAMSRRQPALEKPWRASRESIPQAKKVVRWTRTLGVELVDGEEDFEEHAIARSLRDGWKLCVLVRVLFPKVSMKGVLKKAEKRASRLHNVEQVKLTTSSSQTSPSS